MPSEPSTAGLLIVISAPSGAGKTTLCQSLMDKRPNTVRAITCTTRQPRNGEKDGVDYFFLSVDEFTRRVGLGEFLEHATVYGNKYGVLKQEALGKLREGKDVLLSVDVQGAESIRECPDTELQSALVTIFLVPASMQVLEQRLRKRNQDSDEVIARRLAMAREEIGHAHHFHYVIVSDTPERDYEMTHAILIAEKLRQERFKCPAY